jgi:hypothetical protein
LASGPEEEEGKTRKKHNNFPKESKEKEDD